MLKIQTSNGETLTFDLRSEEQRAAWERQAASNKFQKKIRGISLLQHKVLSALPLPKRFNSLHFSAGVIMGKGSQEGNLLGEWATCQADSIQIKLTAYYTDTPKMVRVDVVRIGRQRHVAGHGGKHVG